MVATRKTEGPAAAAGSAMDTSAELPVRGLDDAVSAAEQLDLPRNEEPTAADRVFATYELAEMVIAHLPLADVISMYRVCRSARDIIKDSKTIQENLYFLDHSQRMGGMDQLVPSPPFTKSASVDFRLPRLKGAEDVYFALKHLRREQEGGVSSIGFRWLSGSKYVLKHGLESHWKGYQRRVISVKKNEMKKKAFLWRRIKLFKPEDKTATTIYLEMTANFKTTWVKTELKTEPTLGEVYDLLCKLMEDLLVALKED